MCRKQLTGLNKPLRQCFQVFLKALLMITENNPKRQTADPLWGSPKLGLSETVLDRTCHLPVTVKRSILQIVLDMYYKAIKRASYMRRPASTADRLPFFSEPEGHGMPVAYTGNLNPARPAGPGGRAQAGATGYY
jgi:hypothetical protein